MHKLEGEVAEPIADFVAFGRPYIANPDLVEWFATALRSPKPAGKPSTGRDRRPFRLSGGRRASELN